MNEVQTFLQQTCLCSDICTCYLLAVKDKIFSKYKYSKNNYSMETIRIPCQLFKCLFMFKLKITKMKSFKNKRIQMVYYLVLWTTGLNAIDNSYEELTLLH